MTSLMKLMIIELLRKRISFLNPLTVLLLVSAGKNEKDTFNELDHAKSVRKGTLNRR